MAYKEKLLYEFSSTLNVFWSEAVAKRGILETWRDFLSTVEESKNLPKEYYTLTRDERKELYKVAGLL